MLFLTSLWQNFTIISLVSGSVEFGAGGLPRRWAVLMGGSIWSESSFLTRLRMIVAQFSFRTDAGILFPENMAQSRRWYASRASNFAVSCDTLSCSVLDSYLASFRSALIAVISSSFLLIAS